MSKVLGLKCKECGEVYEAEGIHVCDLCFGSLEVALAYDGHRTALPLCLMRGATLPPAFRGVKRFNGSGMAVASPLSYPLS